MQDLKITTVQAELKWQDKSANLLHFDNLLKDIASDVIVLPEMFATGFSMDAENNFSEMDGPEHEWMKKTAARIDSVICGSLIIKEDDNFFNRFLWVTPEGQTEFYDKRHLFRMADEHHSYSAGEQNKIVELKGWKLCLQVCYDLRFPVWSRNKDLAYDIVLYVANWPERRSHAWKSLLRARAIENLAYCVGVNRVGKDGNDISYSGDSAILDFLGHEITNIPAHKERIESTVLNYQKLADYREKFPAWKDADNFQLTR